mmetsp:Transcript_17671/g.53166  ORF Transcript_17671/g.53166 Transcript_17671/m.53166 type:complete len:205 (+) Transcript_17671:1672-2286(+)
MLGRDLQVAQHQPLVEIRQLVLDGRNFRVRTPIGQPRQCTRHLHHDAAGQRHEFRHTPRSELGQLIAGLLLLLPPAAPPLLGRSAVCLRRRLSRLGRVLGCLALLGGGAPALSAALPWLGGRRGGGSRRRWQPVRISCRSGWRPRHGGRVGRGIPLGPPLALLLLSGRRGTTAIPRRRRRRRCTVCRCPWRCCDWAVCGGRFYG